MHERLEYPYSFAKRLPVVENRVLFVPTYYQHRRDGSFLCLDDQTCFDRRLPLCVEYCSGNGEWIIDRAMTYAGYNWIAVEKKIERASKIFSKRQNLGLPNLFIVCGDAQSFVRYYMPLVSVTQVYVNFPDPWPKDRHAKHRLIQAPFIRDVADTMVEGGEMILVTDDIHYKEQMLAVVGEEQAFSFLQKDVGDHFCYGSSYFYRLWTDLGKQIHCMQFIRNKLCISQRA